MLTKHPASEPVELGYQLEPLPRAARAPENAPANENMTPGQKVAWLQSFPDEFGFYPDDGRIIRREE